MPVSGIGVNDQHRLKGVVWPIALGLALGCSEPIALGPEHYVLTLAMTGTVTETVELSVAFPEGVRMGDAVLLTWSYVPVHGEGSAGTFNFAESDRSQITLAIGANTWNVFLSQVLLTNDTGDMDRIAAVGNRLTLDERWSTAFDFQDTVEPLDLLHSDSLPVELEDVNVDAAGAGHGALHYGHRNFEPGWRIQFSVDAIAWGSKDPA